ncbi:MAG: hypothetical protein ACRCZS_28300 [Chroococcidiopsis sp.]
MTSEVAIAQAEAIAQSKHLGVWGGDYEKPWDYRKVRKSRDNNSPS